MEGELEKIIAVKPLEGFRLQLTFQDQFKKVVNLKGILKGPIFGPLKNLSKFRKVRVNRRFGCIQWPNGADLCPDALRHGGRWA
jgi:hypothetical protein